VPGRRGETNKIGQKEFYLRFFLSKTEYMSWANGIKERLKVVFAG